MSKLLQILLDSESRPPVIPVNRPRFIERSKGSSTNLMENLRKSARLGESMMLSRGEVRYLLKLVEEASRDPFSSDSVLDDGDLKALGVETKEVGEQYGLIDHEDVPKEEEGIEVGELSSKQPIFGPESALVAPDCTPGGREDIPASVIKSMKIISGEEEVEEYKKEEEAPISQSPQMPQSPRQMPQMPRPQRREENQPETPKVESVSPIAILKTTKALRENSKKQNSRRVIKKVLTDEQKAAIAKLGGAADSLD